MDIKQLAYFVQVYECENLTKAAQKLYISQQGLSLSIGRLEKELGKKLFSRTPYGVTATEDGEYFYPIARGIVDKITLCESYFGNGETMPEVSVALTYGVAEWSPNPIREALMNMNPLYRIRKTLCGAVQADNLVDSESHELGFTINPVDQRKFCNYCLYESRMVFLVNRKHPLAQYDKVHIGQLNGQSIALPNETYKSRDRILKLAEDAGVTFKNVSETTGTFLSPLLVKASPDMIVQTIAAFADSLRDPEIKTLIVEGDRDSDGNELTDFSWRTYLIYKRGKALSPSAARFLEFVLRCLKESEAVGSGVLMG